MTKTKTGKPVRLQLRRLKGFNLQALSIATNGRPAVNCARPGPYGNPFHTNSNGTPMTAQHACVHYRAQLMRMGFVAGPRRSVFVAEIKEKLRGKNLACFCPVKSPFCHVDTLLEVANGD